MTTAPEENPAVETRLVVLEAQMVSVLEGQRQIVARLDSMEQASGARFDSLNNRIDRLFYTVLALGIAAIGTLIALGRFL